MSVEITLGTLIKQLCASKTTMITFKVVFSFLNESKGVWVKGKFICTSKLDIWVIPKNTFGMYRIIGICTVVEPMLWVAFFFTDITVIFIGVIFSGIMESEGMLMLFVPCSLYLAVCGSVAHLKSKANSQVVQRNIGEILESQQLQLCSDSMLERRSRCL